MIPVRWSRVLLGGVLAGLVINIVEFLVNGVLLMTAWGDALRALNRPEQYTTAQVVAFNLWGFLMGIGAVWVYAQIRDRYSPGPRTAIYAGLAVWAIGYAFGAIPSAAMGLFPGRLIGYGLLAGLVEVNIGAVLGAWVYRPRAEARARAAAA
jgi:MFS family permease